MKQKRSGIEPRHVWPFALVTSLFFAWGLVANMTDTLLAAFKRILSLTDFQTTFVQYAYFGAYFCFSIPASLLVGKYGYKAVILAGLGLYISGALLFYPASVELRYGAFLLALYVLAAGVAFLETAANPFVYALGSPATATQRLNFAQVFNPIGAICGALIGKFFILGNLHDVSAQARANLDAHTLEQMQRAELAAVMGPYVVIACVLVLIWLLLAATKIPTEPDRGSGGTAALLTTLGRLLSNRRYVAAVGAQFLYVGAQVGIWSFTIRYVVDRLGVNEAAAASYYTASLILFFVSRLVCTWLMSVIRAQVLLTVLALMAVVLCTIAAFNQTLVGVYALVGVSGCMSLMFPTIYAIGLAGLGADTRFGGAFLVMAIVGGGVITSLQGFVSDRFESIGTSLLVPALCFGIVALFGYVHCGTWRATSEDSVES